MKALKDVHNLIHALAQSEKRYVKLMGKMMGGQEDSGVLILFDLLNNHHDLDVEAILALPTVQGMGKGLPTQLQRLRKLILRAVTILQGEKSVASQLQQMLPEVEFLVNRNFMDEAEVLANRGIALAQKYCYHELCIALLDWKRRMLNERLGREAEIVATLSEMQVAQHQLAELNALRTIHSDLLVLAKKPVRSLHPDDTHRVAELARDPIVVKAQHSTQMLHQFLAMDSLGMHMLLANEGPPALAHYASLIQSWKDAPQWYREAPDLFLVVFKHYQSAVMFGTLDEQALQQYLQDLPEAKHFSTYHQLELSRIHYSHTLTYSMNRGNHLHFKAVIPQILKWLDEHAQQILPATQLAFLHNLTVGCFVFGDFDSANRILQRILNHSSRDVRTDIRDFARLLQVILIHELQRHDLNEYLIRSLRAFLRKQPAQIQFATAVVDYIMVAMRDPQGAAHKTQLTQLAEFLRRLQSQSTGLPITGLSEVMIWLESKRKGIAIQAEFLERVQALTQSAAAK